MDRMHLFVRDEVLPSYFENVWEAALSVLASNFAVTQLDATHLRVPASAGVGAAVIGIQGRPRYVEANVDHAHPGGAAGAYDVFVTAADQNVVNVPAPYTDDTNYAFALAIVAAGATPAIVAGVVDVYRKVASCQWDGAQITQLDPVGNVTVAGIPAAGPVGQAALRKLGAGATDATAGNDARVPTQPENDALQGTSGAPANGNRFVTDADPRNTNTRTPTDGTVTEAKLAAAVDTLLKQRGYYGDGSDGAFTLDGAATPAWATRAGSVYTMTRDCYCTNLTVNAGVTLITAGFVPFCTGTFNNAGTTHNDANGQNAGPAGSLGGGGNGGAATTAGATVNGSQGGAGGASGGAGSSAGGAANRPAGGLRRHISAWLTTTLTGGAGGGGGNIGGVGGGGGGVVIIAAPTIINSGAIHARGAAGGTVAAKPSGGGGGGGFVGLAGGSITNTGAIDANAGAGGADVGGGAGVAGTAGNVVQLAA